MILYHGTSAEYLDDILKNGLKPRGKSNGNSNWDHTIKSRAGHVYLTSAYGFYFAHCAVRDVPVKKAAVLEIQIDGAAEEALYPDEDFIAQAQRRNGGDLLTKTKRVNLKDFQQSWPLSLKHLGNVCYKGTIPPSSIKRVAIIDVSKRIDLVMNYGDPCISIMNFTILSGQYHHFTNWLFGDVKLLPGMIGMDLEALEKEGGLFSERATQIRKLSADRHGIEVRKVS